MTNIQRIKGVLLLNTISKNKTNKRNDQFWTTFSQKLIGTDILNK